MASEILTNPRHERFAQAVANGESAAKAYSLSGYLNKNDQVLAVNASRLLKTAKVRDRVSFLRTQLFEEALRLAGFSRSLVLKKLMDNAENAPEFAAKNRALELLGKELGMFVDRTDAKVTVRTLADLSEEDLAAIIQQAEDAEKRKQAIM